MFRLSEDYEHFADFIRTKSRYVLDGWQQDFVNTVARKLKVPAQLRATDTTTLTWDQLTSVITQKRP
jgi:hypothetical protein